MVKYVKLIIVSNYNEFVKVFEKKGFTLAEVLITLGIIGIVAAMTIPTLMNNIQDAQFKSVWKKEYSALAQAAQRYVQENTTFVGVTNYPAALGAYMNVNKYCTTSYTEGCWLPSDSYKYLKSNVCGSIAGIPDNCGNKNLGTSRGMILSDGTTITTLAAWPNCDLWGGACAWILVDVNGFRLPNVVGRDTFGLWVIKNKIVPMGGVTGMSAGTFPGCGNGDNGEGDMGFGCSAQYLSQ